MRKTKTLRILITLIRITMCESTAWRMKKKTKNTEKEKIWRRRINAENNNNKVNCMDQIRLIWGTVFF